MQDTDCRSQSPLDRRSFLVRSAAGLSAAWVTAQWPAIISASEHAHAAANAPLPAKFEFFTPVEAKEVEALSSAIIPSDSTPGAREAGVVYFIDRALVTFAVDDQKTYRQGLPEIQKRVKELFPDLASFSAASSEQQIAILESLDGASKDASTRPQRARYRPSPAGAPLFEVLRAHTITGFLVDPDSDRRGNRGGVGWTVLGRELGHSFQPPFSKIDVGYPGWQAPAAISAQQTKDVDKK